MDCKALYLLYLWRNLQLGGDFHVLINVYYEKKMEEYNITHVILAKNSKLNMFISRDENYEKLYEDDNFVIYERNV